MPQEDHRIFAGTFILTTDDFLLNPDNRDLPPFTDLTLPLDLQLLPDLEARFSKHRVSILGRVGTRSLGSLEILTLLVDKMVLQAEIARRAFAIFEAGQAGSALDNWLRAERQLLGL